MGDGLLACICLLLPLGTLPQSSNTSGQRISWCLPQTSLFNWILFLLELHWGKHVFLCCGNVTGGFIHIVNLGRISSPDRHRYRSVPGVAVPWLGFHGSNCRVYSVTAGLKIKVQAWGGDWGRWWPVPWHLSLAFGQGSDKNSDHLLPRRWRGEGRECS